MKLLLSEEADSSEFHINESKKVRIHSFVNEGIEVKRNPVDKWLGFIPYCYLDEDYNNLWIGKALYVTYIGQNERYLLFAERNPLENIHEYNKMEGFAKANK